MRNKIKALIKFPILSSWYPFGHQRLDQDLPFTYSSKLNIGRFWRRCAPQNDSAGQALIEVLAALAIAMVVLTALAAAAITSVRNASFAKNQTLANEYSRQAMESIRAYRDLNSSSFFAKADGCYAIDKANVLSTITDGLQITATALPCNVLNASPSTNENLGNGFTQQIALEANPTLSSPCPAPVGVAANSCKSITVYVFWTDAAGTHKSNLTSYFGKWQ